MKRLVLIVCLVIVGGLIGCQGEGAVMPSSQVVTSTMLPVTKTVTLTATPRAVATTVVPSPTASLVPTHSATPTATTTPTPTGELPLANFRVVEQCMKIESLLPQDFILEGKLIRHCEQGACSLDIHGTDIREMPIVSKEPDQWFWQWAVSPDRKKLFYELVTQDENWEIKSRQFGLITADGQQLPMSPVPTGWRLDGWRDNNLLNLDMWKDEEHFVAVFDPLTGTITETLLPPLENPFKGSLIIKDPRASYDPTYDRVIYLTEPGDEWELWDVWANKLLWHGNKFTLLWAFWSPDGQQVAVDSGDLFIVGRDGEETQLTNFSVAYPNMGVSIGNISWSPDGRYIALWLNIHPGEYFVQWRLVILDIQTGQAIDYCIPSEEGQWPNSVWSPSGQQIAVNTFTGYELDTLSVVIVDLNRDIAVKLPGHHAVLGWMVSP